MGNVKAASAMADRMVVVGKGHPRHMVEVTVELFEDMVAKPLRDSLDAAWAEAEAALPEGHVLAEVRLFDDGTLWGASTNNVTGVGRYHWSGDGPTPAAALRALATNLREVGK